MRTDDNLARNSFRFSEEWQRGEEGAALDPAIDRRLSGGQLENGRYVVHSLSGHERNTLFMNAAGDSFTDASALSGLDNPADGRGFALLDYNRDGRTDIALVNANVPAFNLYRNDIDQTGNVIAIRFEGSNQEPTVGIGSVRDGYGALAIATLPDGQVLKREHRCGEGFASQNSATMLIGIGEATSARLQVKWPSGKVFELDNVPAGQLVLARENARDPFTTEVYLRASRPASQPSPIATPTLGVFPLVAKDIEANPEARIRIYTTMATWCESCLRHLPEVNAMCEVLADEEIEIVALPIDVADDERKLAAYTKKYQPRYRLVKVLAPSDRQELAHFLAKHLQTAEPPLPSTVVADGAGNALQVMAGLPSSSDIRRLILTLTKAGQELSETE